MHKAPIVYSYDNIWVGFKNRVQIWKPCPFKKWYEFFYLSNILETKIKRDVYDYWERLHIRLSIVNICIVTGRSIIQHIHNGRVLKFELEDEDC